MNRPPRRIEESYSAAACTSNLNSDEIQSGAAHLLVASGIAAAAGRSQILGHPSSALGHALARLQSEWETVEKPHRQQPRSVKQWTEALPLVKDGDRLVRDRAQAHAKQQEECEHLADIHLHALRMLAQRLPSRLTVRRHLFDVACLWEWEGAETKVAAVLLHWLSDACPHCHGTGEALRGAKVQVCPVCKGAQRAPIPCGAEGYRLHALMVDSKARWLTGVKTMSRLLHQGGQTPTD